MKLLISYLAIMRNKINFLIVALALILFQPILLKAGKETRNARLSGAAFVNGAYVEAYDDKFTGAPGWVVGFKNISSDAKVELGINEDLHILHPSKFKTTVTFDVELTDEFLVSTLFTNQQLTVDYDPAAGTRYTDKSQFIWNGYYRVRVTNINIKTFDAANNLIANPSDLFLETEISSIKYYDFQQGITTFPFPLTDYSHKLTADNELEVDWNYIPGAEEYELEWTFVDNHTIGIPGNTKPSSSIEYDLDHDATRIITSNQFYRIPLTYERGYIIYRIRPIGRDQITSLRLDGAWTNVPATAFVSAAIATSPTQNWYQIGVPLSNFKFNWQSVKTFAEDGKQGVGVSYNDGLMFNRQSIARLNTEDKSIVQNTIYDYYARPAINLLPAPVNGKNFSYYKNLNLYKTGAGTKIFDKSVFDQNCYVTVCGGPLKYFRLDTNASVGGAKYYSGSNPNQLGLNGYIPSAHGMPYVQNLYLNDPLNRVARSTMPGLTHALGGGSTIPSNMHDVQYLYSSNLPQPELDRLFGLEAGLSKYFWKYATIDPNGQSSASYIDQYGRTVATALLCDQPVGLDPLPDKGSLQVLTQDLAALNYYDPVNYCITVNTDVLVTCPPDMQTFQYSADPAIFTANDCLPPICFECVYDLEISILGPCGEQYVQDACNPSNIPKILNVSVGKQPPYLPIACPTNTSSGTSTDRPLTGAGGGISLYGYQLCAPLGMTITFPKSGVYTINKKICVSNAPINDYVKAYLNDPDCNKTVCHFVDSLTAKADFSGCGFDCSQCSTAVIAYQNNVVSGSEIDRLPLTPAELNKLLAECKLFCPQTLTSCDRMKQVMLNDFKPGGQFAQQSPSDPNWNYSLFNPLNLLGFPQTGVHHFWQVPPTPAYGLNPSPTPGVSNFYKDGAGIYASVLIGGVNFAPEVLTAAQFQSNFNDSWAEAFLPLHPDYCKYKFYCGQISTSWEYDEKMKAVDNFDDACALGFLDPINPTLTSPSPPTFPYGPPAVCKNTVVTPANYDPLFQNPLRATIAAADLNTFYANIANVAGTGRTMYEQAVIAALGLTGATAPQIASTLGSHAMGSDICTKDNEWYTFRQVYQNYKNQLYVNMYNTFVANQAANGMHCIDPPPGYTSLISPDTEGEITATFTLPANPGANTPAWAAAAAAYTLAQCSTACQSYSVSWISYLSANCNYTSLTATQQSNLIRDLIAVCSLGCDGNHTNGASTLPTGIFYTIPTTAINCSSFQDVFNYYFGLTGPNPNCSSTGLPFPAPYTYSGSGTSGPQLSSCNCDKILGTDLDFNTITYIKPPGITTGRKLFKYRFGFDLGAYNHLVCSCKAALTIGNTWAPGYVWSATELSNLVAAQIPVAPQLKCDDCLSCTQVATVVNNLATSLGATTIDYAFFLNNSQTILNTINYANNTSFDMIQLMNLYNECNNNTSPTAPIIVSTGLSPYASQIEKILNDWAFKKQLAFDHPMSVCNDSKYFLSSLYSGSLPNVTVTNYQKIITGSLLTINLLDALSNVIASFNLTLPATATYNWTQVTSITNLRGYAVQPATPGNNFGFIVTISNGIDSDDAVGSDTNWPIFTLSNTSPPKPMICDTPPPINQNQCKKDLMAGILSQAQNIYLAYINALTAQFILNYKTYCFNNLKEQFTRTYKLNEYHYTLYYYDQSGNLVRTVAPKGVTLLSPPYNVYPQHALYSGQDPVQTNFVNEYKFNSYNQPITERTIDGGKTNYFYDLTGRIMASQNARQANVSAYSYVFYDAFGRINEVGEVRNSTFMTGILTEAIAEDPSLFNSFVSGGARTEVTKTFYDVINYPGVFIAGQNNLRNRVTDIIYQEVYNPNNLIYDYATHYSYDEHGNVNELIQDYPSLGILPNEQYKDIKYDYDLISGNVNSVSYQAGAPDQYFHKYCYDSDNRLFEAYSSRDGSIWDKDGKYFYYQHGPLARMEKGDKKVEGCDYFYTIQGWIKGINSNNLAPNTDPGKDGNNSSAYSSLIAGIHAYIARDAAAYALNYYDNYSPLTESDYNAIKPFPGPNDFNPMANVNALATTSFSLDNSVMNTSDAPNLFNGNIKSMVTTITNKGQNNTPLAQNALPQITAYHYDQLHRITQQKAFHSMNLPNNIWNVSSTSNYDDSYFMNTQFDQNGNIVSLKRKGVAPTTKTGSILDMDDLKYYYPTIGAAMPVAPFPTFTYNNNQLNIVTDNVANNNYDVDIDDETGAPAGTGGGPNPNYLYNEIGSMLVDRSEKIAAIIWSVDRKVKRVLRNGTPKILSTGPYYPPDLEYQYDGNRRRVLKIEKPWDQSTGLLKSQPNWKYTYYVYDASGNVMATYTRSFAKVPLTTNTYNDEFTLIEQDIYGSNRIGINDNVKILASRNFNASIIPSTFNYDFGGTTQSMTQNVFGSVVYAATSIFNEDNNNKTRLLGSKQYEITNHLGNVITTISDRKIQVPNTGNTALDYYNSDILSTNDYYAFGMDMPGRNYTLQGYRYGYESQEIEDEVSGGRNQYSFEYRKHDPRLGRFWSVDPLAGKYVWNSPYAFSGNRVTNSIELEGLEPFDLNSEGSVDYGAGEQGPQPLPKGTVYGPYANQASARSAALSGNASVSLPEAEIATSPSNVLSSRFNNPAKIEQANSNLCGITCLAQALACHDPNKYTEMLKDFYLQYGNAQDARGTMGMTSESDWYMLMGLKKITTPAYGNDAGNSWPEKFWAMTFPHEMQILADKLGFKTYGNSLSVFPGVGNVDNFFANLDAEAIAGRTVIMLINSEAINGDTQGNVPNHYIIYNAGSYKSYSDGSFEFNAQTLGQSSKPYGPVNKARADLKGLFGALIIGK